MADLCMPVVEVDSAHWSANKQKDMPSYDSLVATGLDHGSTLDALGSSVCWGHTAFA